MHNVMTTSAQWNNVFQLIVEWIVIHMMAVHSWFIAELTFAKFKTTLRSGTGSAFVGSSFKFVPLMMIWTFVCVNH
jgi:hypothetical protein